MSGDEQIHAELLDINRSLGRIEGSLETLVDLPDRMRALEGWRKWILGFQAAIAAAWVMLFQSR